MVEQTRRESGVVSLQAGPGEVDTGTMFDMNRRISDRTARAVARQLAAIGDQLDREWTIRQPNRLPTPLHMLRPAQVLTRTMYRDIHNQLWGLQGLSAAVKAWVVTSVPGHGVRRAEAWTAWVSSMNAVTRSDRSRGAAMTVALVALVAALTLVSTMWTDWRD
ncbi:bcl-2-interacting killer [Solea solea]|uniref:bcl-2-interacting killer n=1 Tax=Solea solea TaxID=90069 RepID=UPI00272C01E8|nr:bcl-2-interacting killer [Solea solea]